MSNKFQQAHKLNSLISRTLKSMLGKKNSRPNKVRAMDAVAFSQWLLFPVAGNSNSEDKMVL